MIRRRQNLRFLATIGIIVLIVFFLLLIVQFSQIENDPGSNAYRNKKKFEQENRLKHLNDKVKNKHPARFQDTDDTNNNNNEVNQENENLKNIEKPELDPAIVSMHKLVHLDLKGSPPKLNYLKELIPYFKSIGATGVLLEYEDFFPYDKDLESIANQNHYTQSELSQIFALIKEHKLMLIPLIQTYGHLEYVLKLKQYASLREDAKHFNVITPCLNDTYEKVVFRMIDQILYLHPADMQYLHIGCDEVYFVNKNPACATMNLHTVQDFFIHHVQKILKYIKSKRPNLKVMIWEDMIRHNMINNGVNNALMSFAKEIIPVVWNYREQVEVTDNVWRDRKSVV